MATLTRDEMEAVIKGGGSVLYQGRTLSSVAQLPSVAELAQGDPDKEAAATADLQAQIAQLQQQLATLQPSAPAAKSSKKKPTDPAEGDGGDTPSS